jgi:uncharacterized membrane protein
MKNRKKMILGTILAVIVLILIIFQFKSGKTIVLNHQIEIDKGPSQVWETLNNLESVAEYNPQVKKAECITNDKTGIGASRVCTMTDGSKVKERVIEVEENKAITMELYESNWPVKDMKWRTVIENKEGKTLVTQKLEYKMKFGAFGAILNALFLENKMNSTLQDVFNKMKSHIESKK